MRFPIKAVALLGCVLGLCFSGCSRQSQQADSSNAQAPGPAAYPEISAAPSTFIPRLHPNGAQSNDWRHAGFYALQTELTPAILFFTTNKYFSFFEGLTNYGLSAPSHIAFITRNGPRSFMNGSRLVADEMEECWLLVWFASAKGWTNWDAPWVIFLQHKPYSMKLDQDGLHLSFHQGAEHVVAMPLYGLQKLPLQGQRLQMDSKPPQSKPKKVETWKWAEGVRRDVLLRVRYWASAMREFPIYCEDSFSVDRRKDAVIIRQKFEWISIRDDWNTKPLKLAPVSPALARFAKDEQPIVQFSKPVADLDMPTLYGPYMGVEETDAYDVTLNILGYINEGLTNAVRPEDTRFIMNRIRWAGFQAGMESAGTNFIAMARTAYRAGDIDTYDYACYLFARTFTPESTVHPSRVQRLIPSARPTPFVAGLERQIGRPNGPLVAHIRWRDENGQIVWPCLEWPDVSFGHIQAGKDVLPKRARVVPLNWNTEVIVYE